MFLVDLVSQRTHWLSTRQAVIAGNIANSDTPGYRAKDVVPFDVQMARTQSSILRTDPRHIEKNALGIAETDEFAGAVSNAKHSGNTVNLERQLLKAGEISRGHTLAMTAMKNFQGMLLSVTRG